MAAVVEWSRARHERQLGGLTAFDARLERGPGCRPAPKEAD